MDYINGLDHYNDETSQAYLLDENFQSKTWLYAAGLVGGLITFGVILTLWGVTGTILPTGSFSARVSVFYCFAAGIIIFFGGWFNFPLAAALYYGYLGVGQAASSTYFFGADNNAITFEMLLAIPLIIVGLLHPPAKRDNLSIPAPGILKTSFVLILLSALASTLFSVSPKISLFTFASRFLIPILVTLVSFRSLRNMSDFKTIWSGFMTGMLAIAVFDFRRAVLGAGQVYGINQRFIGATMSFAIPSLVLIGGALWLGYAYAEHRSMLKGLFLVLLAGFLGVLIWLSGSRGTFVGFVLVCLWWFPFKAFKALMRPKLLLMFAVSGMLLIFFLAFAMQRTNLDVTLIIRRFDRLISEGLKASGRWPIWMDGLGYWKEAPLFGKGLNSWVVLNYEFASVHGSFIGIFLDTGLFGAFSFFCFFVTILFLSRKKYIANLNSLDFQFFIGIRNSWIVMMLVLAVNLPFTSGQPRNNIFSYMIYMLPMLVMLVHTRYGYNYTFER